jgi:hypothetical protein
MVWVSETYHWLFDGVAGAAVVGIAGYLLKRLLKSRSSEGASLTAQGAKVTGSPVASGSGITQNINSHNINLSMPGSPEKRDSGCDFWLEFDPRGSHPLMIQNNGPEPAFEVAVKIPADGSGFTSDVINRLDNDRGWRSVGSNGNFVYLDYLRNTIVETILRHDSHETRLQEIAVLISYRTYTEQSCEFHLEIRLPLRNGIQFSLPQKPIEHSLDGKILQFLDTGITSEDVPFSGAGLRFFRASQIASAISAPQDVVSHRLERLQSCGRVQRSEGTLDNAAPRWSLARR